MDRPLWPLACDLYFPARMRIRSPLTKQQYFWAVENLAAMLDREPLVADLNDETLIKLVHWLEARGLAAKTINERVGRLKTLWGWLWRKGQLTCGPTVEKIPEPQRLPRAWDREQLAALFAGAREMPGRVGPFLASKWWFALLATAWFTGERTMALLRLRWDMLQDHTLYVPAEIRKGQQKDACYILPPKLLALLIPLSGRQPEIFHWPMTLCTFYLHYGKLLRLAGLPVGRSQKLQKVRRSHATWRKILFGDATESLMHDDPSTTERFYIDRSLGDDQPPPLFCPWESG